MTLLTGMAGLNPARRTLLVAACVLCCACANTAPVPDTENGTFRIHITLEQAEQIGRRIWQNEGAGKFENLAVWNEGEEFPSLGIGHFIWFPPGIDPPFTESFPQLLVHLGRSRKLPDWLAQATAAPWQNRADFYANAQSSRMIELRQLLAQTIPEQTFFILARLEAAVPRIMEAAADTSQREHIRHQFERMAASPAGTFAMIDYVNFKGEGLSAKERYQGEGWGLLQVLDTMRSDAEDPIEEFVRAADHVLTRRVENAERDESRWLPGWRRRIEGYKQQIVN